MGRILNRRWQMQAGNNVTRALGGRAGTAKAAMLRRVPQRFHAITDELAKFGTIGLINLVVNFAVFNLLWFTLLRSGEVKAKAVATIVATTCAYFLNRHWTYKDRPKSTLRREYTLFFLFNVVGLIIEVTVVYVAKYGFHQTHIVMLNLCTAIGIGLGTVFRFWAYRTHVFKAETVAIVDGPLVDAPVASPESPVVVVASAEPPILESAGADLASTGADLASTGADTDERDEDADDEDLKPAELVAEHELDQQEEFEDQELQRELVQLELADIVEQAEQPVRR